MGVEYESPVTGRWHRAHGYGVDSLESLERFLHENPKVTEVTVVTGSGVSNTYRLAPSKRYRVFVDVEAEDEEHAKKVAYGFFKPHADTQVERIEDE